MASQTSDGQASPQPQPHHHHHHSPKDELKTHQRRGSEGVAGWKVYDDTKAAWVDAWFNQYGGDSSKSSHGSWGRHHNGTEKSERRGRSGSESKSSFSPNATPTTTKFSFNLSVDADLAATARTWSKSTEREARYTPRRRATDPGPATFASSSSPPRSSSTPRPMKSTIFTPASFASASHPPASDRVPDVQPQGPPPPYTPSIFGSNEHQESAGSKPIPIPRRSSTSPSPPPYMSRSAPSNNNLHRFWASAFEDPSEERKRREREKEESRRRETDDFERQRELARQLLEQQKKERLLAAERAAKKAALDAEIAAARKADEEREKRRATARADARRQLLEEVERRRSEDKARREEEKISRQQERLRREAEIRQRSTDWTRYEDRWCELGQPCSSDDELTFSSFVWPMEMQPTSSEGITGEAIEAFLLSATHSANKSARHRIREQLLRFHPDRFDARWLRRVRDDDKAEVQAAAGAVARELNEMLSRCF